MDTPTYIPDTTLPQSQQDSSDPLPSPGSSQVSIEVSLEEEELRYLCSICYASYAQRTGAWRHIRTVHNPKLCFLCSEFRWARPYEYRNHLLKKHPDVNPDVILGKTPGSRRRATILTEHLPQQPQQPPASSPSIGQDQQNWVESQPNPSAPPFPTGARDTSVSSPAVSSMDCNSQPVYAVQTVTIDEHEYTHGSEVLSPTYNLPVLLSTEEWVEQNDVVQEQFVLPSTHPGHGGSTATRSPSNLETAPFPTPFTPVDEDYGALVPEYCKVGSFEPMRNCPLSNADIDAAFNSIFNSTF